MDGDIPGGDHAQAHFVAADFDYGQGDVVVDDDGLASYPAHY